MDAELATAVRRARRVTITRSALPGIGLLALVWGSAFLWIKLADGGFSPVEVTLGRLVLGTAMLFVMVLAGVALTRRQSKPAGVP